mgnify:FL=1
MRIMTYIFAFIMFACVGSFIGVCAYRIPKGEQILKGRSYCDECGRQLGALEMVPIISFIFLRGKCKGCKKRISFVSTAIELATAILGILCLYVYGLTPTGIVYSIVTCVLIEIAVLDYKMMEISDVAVIIIALLGIGLMIWQSDYIMSLIGALCVSIPFLVLALCKAMGMGDVKLIAAVGVLLGYKGVLVASFFGVVIGCFVAIAMKLKNKKGWKSEIAFGPYLCAGTYLSMLIGDQIISAYLALFQ